MKILLTLNSLEILERANVSLIFGIIVTVLSIILNRFNRKPNYSNLKGKSKIEILKTGVKLISYNRAQGFVFLGISLILFSIVFYIWYLIS